MEDVGEVVVSAAKKKRGGGADTLGFHVFGDVQGKETSSRQPQTSC